MGSRPWVNYHHLLYFKTIAEHGGIAKAAKKLRLGQPTLSVQMKKFEETLGHALFDRSKRQLQLSDAGRKVFEYAKEIFRLGDEMVDVLNDQHVAAKVQVQIGATDTVPKHLALKVFQHAQAAFDCVVSITNGHGDEMLRELRANRIDLIVSSYPPPVGDAAGFYAKSITKMPVVVCGSSKFSGLKRGFPESLRDQPFVLPMLQSKLRSDVDHFLKLRDIPIDLVGEVQDIGLQKLMATHGDCLVTLPLPAAEEMIAQKELIALGTLQDVHEELWLIAAQRRIQNPVAAAIMKEFSL